MDITKDIKLCNKIIEQYKNLASEDGAGAFELSKISLSMYDRLNEIRVNIDKITLAENEKKTKSDLKEYIRGKMKVMDYIHISSRGIFNQCMNDSKKFKRV
ncbi:hypothetical protein [Clostridium sp. YIM B02551]|uniref:hypothetical protein n=1 Tax=Clostridium sp. YIM B02551 TaxID=2910679 RepID=UPI001EEBF2B5|nr:hypothetical protein [Clostridium sp. YIM B02551]